MAEARPQSSRAVSAAVVVMVWDADLNMNATRAIEKSTDLAAGFYELVADVLATPPSNTYADVNPPGASGVFYRIRAK
ncbi:MAG: hypothetical protein NT154_12635 [Verrucomicrobia bacterium]|nr:hypothetical protein [Verrucomicrobiota bacterium]